MQAGQRFHVTQFCFAFLSGSLTHIMGKYTWKIFVSNITSCQVTEAQISSETKTLNNVLVALL